MAPLRVEPKTASSRAASTGGVASANFRLARANAVAKLIRRVVASGPSQASSVFLYPSGRQAAEKRHPELVHRAEQRSDIADRHTRGAHRRDHKLIGRLVFRARAFPEFVAGEERPQDFSNIAVGLEKPGREPLDQLWGRLVGDKVLRQLERDVTGGRRAARQDVERLLTLRLAARLQLMAEENLWAVIVTRAFEDRGMFGKEAGIRLD